MKALDEVLSFKIKHFRLARQISVMSKVTNGINTIDTIKSKVQ